METIQLSTIKNQLNIRKEKLDEAARQTPDLSNLMGLLKQVDTALEKINNGTYGICEICHSSVEEERLIMDPLISVCLGCLSDDQRRALENDLEFAAKIQHKLLPKNNIEANGWSFSYYYNPAGAVSGDFCDFIPLADDSSVFVIGDVSGKGIGASLMMSHLNALIRSLLSFNLPVNDIVEKANRLFGESVLFANYATMVFGKLKTNGEVEICVAGHNPPFIIKNGNVIKQNPTGIPVGLFNDYKYEVETFMLDKGDSVFLYTDGLTEASINGIEFGEERIKSQLLRLYGHSNGSEHFPAQRILDEVLNDHKTWLGNNKPADDLTAMVISRI